ncbi:MAG: MBL fold metallo-hydrolase, partial [Pseudomonadota bacterium]
VTGGLVTHCRFGHWDHLDSKGARLLAELKVPVYCGSGDVRYLEKKGIRAVGMVPEKARPFLNGRITPVAAEHGKGIIRRFMGPGLGFFLDLPGEPSLYIAGDTVLTARVREVLQNLRPQVAIVNAGSAVLDIGKPILMPLDEIIEFVQTAPGVVVAVHMNAVNHCMTDRKTLKAKLLEMNLSEKVWIPEEGETLSLQADGSCSIPLDRGAL